jgi:CHAT domain-containing protein/tetratricopeptide (TPR) repeat protein
MEEQRLQAYLELIQSLLACPNGEKNDVLNAQRDLLDMGLVAVMGEVAEHLLADEYINESSFLQDLAAQLNSHSENMEEQRFQLVSKLSTCSNSDEIDAILSTHLNIVDNSLVALMESFMERMLIDGDIDTVDFLRDIVTQVTQSSWYQHGRESMQFLVSLVEVVMEKDNATEVIHGLMRNNLVLVDRFLGAAMKRFVEDQLEGQPHAAESIAAILADVCVCVRQFPYAKLIEVNEIALMGYKIALELLKDNSYKYTQILNNSGVAHRALAEMNVEPVENLHKALLIYKQAEQVSRSTDIAENLSISLNNSGNAYATLAKFDKNKANDLYQAISCYKEAEQIRRDEKLVKDLCTTLLNLGGAHLSLAQMGIEGIDNLNQAILIFQEATEISRENGFEKNLLSSIANTGNAYSIMAKILNVDPVKNFHLAVAQYEQWEDLIKDETILTKLELSESFSNIGQTFMSLAEMNIEPINNFSRAITFYEEIISIKKNTGSISVENEYHLDLSRLSISYLSLSKLGVDTIHNLYSAIHCLEESVRIEKSADLTKELAVSLQNIGAVYLALFDQEIDRINCCYKAIYFLEESIKIDRVRKENEEDANAFANLGIAYRHLARMGVETVETMNKSIASYTEAARINRFKNLTIDLAATLNNMGIAYVTLAEMNINSVNNFTLALAIYEEALEIYRNEDLVNDTWMLLQNMGNVYLDLAQIDVDRVKNAEKAMVAYREAEEICKSSELLTYELFRILHKKGNVSLALAEMGEEADLNYNHAINYYREALIFFTSKNLPSDSLRTGGALGNIGVKLGNWDIAIEGYSLAIEAIEQNRAWSMEESHKEEVQAEAISIYINIVQALIQLHRYSEALQYVERARSKRLFDLMRVNDFYQKGEIPAEIRIKLDAYDTLQRQIDAIYHKLDGSQHHITLDTLRPSISGIEQQQIVELQAKQTNLWQELRRKDPIAAAGKRVSPLEINEIGQLLGNSTSTALLSFFSTTTNTFIFIVRRDSQQQLQISTHQCDGQDIGTINYWILKEWLEPYRSNSKQWSQQITTFLQECSDRLELDTLIEKHLDDTITDLILIPYLYLHQIPFAALPLKAQEDETKRQTFGDRFTIRYAPSCEILKICADRPSIDSQSNYGIIEGASLDVPYAAFQGDAIATLLNIPPTQRLRGIEAATINNFKQLAQTVNILHSYHHASSDPNEPLQSSLALADGNITLAQLLVWQLTGLEEVFLSCCETAFGISQTTTDEVITLASGFLCAGARTVIATLWSVEQLSAALLCIFYYEQREKGLDRPHSLQAAQQQLRQLSGTTLENEYGDRLEAGLEVHRQQLYCAYEIEQAKGETAAQVSFDRLKSVEDIIKNLPQLYAQAYPFTDPVYWAAFTCQGLP